MNAEGYVPRGLLWDGGRRIGKCTIHMAKTCSAAWYKRRGHATVKKFSDFLGLAAKDRMVAIEFKPAYKKELEAKFEKKGLSLDHVLTEQQDT